MKKYFLCVEKPGILKLEKHQKENCYDKVQIISF